jgi:hypothetical protein
MRKSDIGKLYCFQFPKRKNDILGIVLAYNEEWILVKRLYDYSLDGYTVFRNNGLTYMQGDYEKFAAKILKAKKYSHLKEPRIPIDSLEVLLTFIDKKYKLVQLDAKDGEAFDVVRFSGKKSSTYHFDELTARAKWRYKLELAENKVDYISFNNDYLNSLN